MTTFPKKIVEKLQVVPGGVTNLVKKGESNFRPDVPPPQPPDNGYGDALVFSTHNNHPTEGELPIMLMMVVLDNSWKLVDTDTGTLVADGLGNRVDGVEIQQSDEGEGAPGMPNAVEVMVVLSQTGSSDKKYRLTGNIMMMAMADFSQMSPPQPGPGTMSVSEGSVGRVIIHQWLAGVIQQVFSLANINLQVPRHLSPDIVSTQHMFAFSNLFNQDISSWDTSRVTLMSTMFMSATAFNQDISGWDVSNVINMDSMFDSASQFNQDLSPWCVRKIPYKPSGFDNQASRWVKSRPSWGTCPAEEEEPPYVPPVEEEVDDDTVIKEFDYALIRYRWTPTGGEDLDTRTYLSKPYRVGRKVGWSRLKNDNSYLIWNEDNTGSGVESVLIDIDKIHDDYPGEQIIELKMDGFWYSQVKSGKLDIEFATFKGGRMVASGYDWINEGGLAIQILKLGVDTLVKQSADIEGENLATLHYDTLLKKGTLVARDGPSIGDGGTDEPEVPVTPPEEGGNGPGGIVDPTNPVYPDSEQGFTFSVEILDNDQGAVPFEIRLVNVTPGWRVYSGNTFILSAEKIHPQVSANVAMGDVTLTFAIPRKDIKTYTIIAEARTLAFEITQSSYRGQNIAINRFSSTILNHQFSVTDANLTVPAVLPSYITSTFNMFLGANYFNQDISTWDTSRVTNMSGMFDNAETFNQDISGWDVSNVTNMMFMFRYAHKFNQPIGSWNVKNVTNMKSMFESAPAFNQDLSKWCVRKIATKPDRFDYSAHALYSSHLPVWGTCPVTYPPGVPLEFNLTTPTDSTQTAPLTFELDEWGTGWALYEDDVLVSNSETVGPGVTHSMGGHNRQIIKIDRDNFANKTVNYKMFVNNEHLNVSRGFNESSSIYPSVEVLSFSDTSRRQSLRFAWTDMTVPTALPQNINSTVTMFDGCQRFNQDISMWDTSYVEDMSAMFRNCISFNQPIGGWDVRNVTDLSDMFSGCTSFNQDISGWDVSRVKRLQGTFRDATVFNSDISGWGLDSVMDYQSTFKNAREFNQDISGWNTSNVLYTSQMFSGAYSFNQDISKWDVKQVQLMKEMFYEARSFNQDLSGWCVTNITSKPNLFSDGAVAWTKPKPVWGTCPVIVEKTIQFDVDNTANDYVSVFEIQALSSDFFNISRDGQAIYVSGPIASADEIIQSNVWPNKTVTILVPPRTMRSYSVSSTNGLPKFVLTTNASNQNIATIRVKSFDAKTPHYQFNVYSWPLYIDDTLPSVVTSGYMMFYGCKAFNTDLSDWDVSNLTNMGYMFYNAETFNRDLSGWNVSHIPTEPDGFSTGTTVWTKPKPIWGTSGGPGGGGPSYDDTGAFKFIVNGAPEVSELAIEMYDPNPDWVLLRDGVLVGGGLQGNGSSITFANTDKSSSEYALIGSDFVTILNEGGWSAEVDSIEVTQFPSKTVAVRFGLGGIPFTVPTTLPKNITTLGSMFNGCTKFNQDISMWDTSHVTEMYEVFKDCALFNQPLNTWDVSKSPELRGMFQGASVFNQPLDNWHVGAVTNVSDMFRYASKFNQDISSWNVSNVTNMANMFSYASAFNQDLSSWCVTNIPQKPSSFDERANAWTKPKPVWGTCPRNENESEPEVGFTGAFEFKTTNRMTSSPLPVTLRVVSSGKAWSLIDADTKDVIHEVLEGTSIGDTVAVYLDEKGTGAERSYTIEGAASEVSLSINDEGRSDGFIKVESFSGDINQYKYDVKNADITVPLLLPSNVTNTDFMFQGCYNFNQDITGWDTSAITSMEGMFSGCTSFNQEIGNWDVSNVTNMNSMFEGCVIFNGDISSWETHALENMYAMFSDCEAFNQNLNDWDVSNVTDMGMLFSNCRVFNQPLDNWDTSSCVVFGSCFAGAHVFNQNINNWDVTNANDLNYVFSNARAFNQPLSNWVIPELYTLESTFMDATSFNQDISNWNVSMVIDMSYMFQGATAFNKPLNTWDTSSLSYANGMFDGAHNFNQPLDNWVTSSLSRMSTMFSEAKEFNQDLSSWCVTNFDEAPHNFSSGCLDWVESKPIWGTCDDEPARTFNFTFTSGSSVATGAKIRLLVRTLQGGWELYRNGVLVSSRTVTDARVVATPGSYATLAILIEPVASSVENYELKLTAAALELGYTANDGNNHSLAVTQFSNGIALHEFGMSKVALTVPEALPTYVKNLTGMFKGSANFNQNINSWDVSHIKDFSECFKDCTIFNQPLDTWDITSSNSIVSMFENCKAFNQDISSWDITGKPRLLKMFNGCTSFNQSLNAWDVSEVWSFESMFYGCSSLNQDFDDWTINTRTKVNMYAMFSECTVFNGDITTWNTSMVGTTERMFTGCNAFNRDISGWNTATFSNMEYMFQNATRFNQDLSPWNVVKFPTMPYEFARDTPAWTLPKPVWGTAGVAPLKSTFVAVDISGASGTFLTLSKNDGPWTTFNLADPGFDVAAFQSFVITGKDGSSFAFLDWPAPLKPEDANSSDKTPGIGGLVSPAGMVAPGHPDGYSFVDGVYVPPILLNAPVQTRKELNTLRIKQSAGAPAGYDIFFTIPGAVEGGILKVVSTVVFPFTDDDIYAPPL